MPSNIAIVGISAELPSGDYSKINLDHKSFFEFLLNKGEAYERIPSTRFNIDAWKGHGRGRVAVDTGAFLKDIDLFDNVEFGISSRDARSMAPATRKLIERCFLALLDSGIDYRAKKVGCYTSGNSFELSNVSEPDEYDPQGSFAGNPSMLANRISNHLDLLGPSLTVDTACSSSSTAFHLAVQAVINDECQAAVVGGCQLNHRFIDWVAYSQGSILAKDGKSKPFDASADGFSRAEGCVAVVIKPLDVAIRDHDHIYATILGTAINSSGSGGPPGAPVAESQRDAMLGAFKRAERSPREVDFIELHATGTGTGDPTEANWVGSEFQRERELLIGSVKGNIGHTETVAFLASLSKVLSIFEHKIIPPNANLRTLNPRIQWNKYRLRVPIDPVPLPDNPFGGSLIAMASSGIGGSNGHVVLEGPTGTEISDEETPVNLERSVLLMASGLSPRSVHSIAESIIGTLNPLDLPILSTVLGRRSKQMTWRSYAVTSISNPSAISFSSPQYTSRVSDPIIFVFSGQGPQNIDMGRQLFQAFPTFRDSVLEMDFVHSQITKKSIIGDYGLFSGNSPVALPEPWPISLILPSITIFQIALFDLLTSLGIKPDIVMGHSAGETAVLYASGAAPKAMAVELSIIRGSAFSPLENLGGTMAALSCGSEEASALLAQDRSAHADSIVEIACYNSPTAVAIAGESKGIDRILALAQTRGIFGRKIRTKVPIHSSMMESCHDTYCSALQDLFRRFSGPHYPKIPTYSTLTGKHFLGPFDAEYFWDSTRFPVLFTDALTSIGTSYTPTFIEVSPHPVLSSYVMSVVQKSCTVLSTIRRTKPGHHLTESRDLLETFGQLTAIGHNCVDFSFLNDNPSYKSNLTLPEYPFQKKRYPLYPDTPGYTKQMASHRGPLNHKYLKVNQDTHPTLAHHVIRGEPIMPASGFLEMAIEFGACTLMNVNLRSILPLSAEKPVKIDISLNGSYWAVRSFATSAPSSSDSELSQVERVHADGYLSFEEPAQYSDLNLASIRERCEHHVDSGFYPSLSYFSAYGARLQRVTNAYYGSSEALVSVKGLDRSLIDDDDYILHPAILDACIQICIYKPFHGDSNPNVYYLPSRVKTVVIHHPLKSRYFPAHLYSYVKLEKWTPSCLQYNVSIVDDIGRPLCTLNGLEVAKHRIDPFTDINCSFDVVLQPAFLPRDRVHPFDSKSSDLDYPDRIELYDYLDKSVVSPTRENTAWLASQPEASAYVELLQRKTMTNAFLPVIEGPQLDAALSTNCEELRRVLMSFKDTRRLVRLSVLTNVDSFIPRMAEVLKECPTLFYEIYVSNKTHERLIPVDSRLYNVRSLDLEPSGVRERLPKLDSDIDRDPFDILLAFHFAFPGNNLDTIAGVFQDLLLPSGILISTQKNQLAWDQDLPGTVWYNSVFGKPSSAELFLEVRYLEALRKSAFSVTCTRYMERFDPFHFTVVAQKNILDSNAPVPHLFRRTRAFHFEYTKGRETDLQWEFSGLDTSQELDIWITSTEGYHGSSALGLVRALRREYLHWRFHHLLFPPCYTEQSRYDCLERLPYSMADEPEIIITASGDLLIPRLIPLPCNLSQRNPGRFGADFELPPDHVIVRIHASSPQGRVYGVVGTVVASSASGLPEGFLVWGMTTVSSDIVCVDAAAVGVVPGDLSRALVSAAAAHVPGIVSAVLAPGISAFNRQSRLRSLRILLTHADTLTGMAVAEAYSRLEVKFCQVQRDIGLLNLVSMAHTGFDLIVSGYEDQPYVQVLKTLLDPGHGRLFLWKDKAVGLAAILEQDPCSVGAALQSVGHLIEYFIQHPLPTSAQEESIPSETANLRIDECKTAFHAVFDARKTYLILGGIGSIGAHIAMFLYDRGARHITLTSRRGEKKLENSKNLRLKRMFNYLEGLEHLDLHLESVDGTSLTQMKALVEALHPQLGGCFVLTAVLSDGVFQHLTENQFSDVFASKSGVLRVLRDTCDISNLEFVIGFSSVSGLFGAGGQSNYSAANTALEEEISSMPNGFSFVCPGISDSSLMLADRLDVKESLLSHYAEWSMPAEDMVPWLEDAICKYQNGQRFRHYVPNLNWEAMERTHGMTKLGKHLVPNRMIARGPDSQDVELVLMDIVRNALSIPPNDFFVDVPFTAYGIDSLSASKLSFLLRAIVDVSQIQLLADISFEDLRKKITRASSSSPTIRQKVSPTLSKSQAMLSLLTKYSEGMISKHPVRTIPETLAQRHVVLVTGTTGALGCNILAQLLGSPDIDKVYAFNRKAHNGVSLLARQEASFQSQGLLRALCNSSKLVLVEGDLSADDLGVASEMMNELLSSVSQIIHNAWEIDFLAPLLKFEPLIKGTRRLLEFATQSQLPTSPSLTFISSVGIYQHLGSRSIGLEEPVLDPQTTVQTGYLESKWVAERLFQLAADRMRLKTNIIRVGLLTGGLNGSWNTSHWFPSLVQSGVFTGCLPQGDDEISWLPVHIAATAIIDMRDSSHEILHVIHPRPVKWTTIIEPISKMLGVHLVPYPEWFARLQHISSDFDSLQDKECPSALKLVDMYRLGLRDQKERSNTESLGLMPKVASDKGISASPALKEASMPQLGLHDVEKWMGYWHRVGFLRSPQTS